MTYIPPPKSSDCVWRSGPPPEIGWWPASWMSPPDPSVLRWWNGKYWSCCVDHSESSQRAEIRSKLKEVDALILWTDRWWEAK